MVKGPTFLSLPALSGADWYLKFSSQDKRPLGRDLREYRHDTTLWHHVRFPNFYSLFLVFRLSSCKALMLSKTKLDLQERKNSKEEKVRKHGFQKRRQQPY